MLARARGEGVTLLALIYRRLRDLRDAGAREAFERHEAECVVWWEQRERTLTELAEARSGNEVGEVNKRTTSQTPEIFGVGMKLSPADGELRS